MADHGEAFGAHIAGKSGVLPRRLAVQRAHHVPLIFRVPGGSAEHARRRRPADRRRADDRRAARGRPGAVMDGPQPRPGDGRPAAAAPAGVLRADAVDRVGPRGQVDDDRPTASTTSTTGSATRSGRSTISTPTPTRRTNKADAAGAKELEKRSSSGWKVRCPPRGSEAMTDEPVYRNPKPTVDILIELTDAPGHDRAHRAQERAARVGAAGRVHRRG